MTEEDERAGRDGENWQKWGEQFGWRLASWTFDRYAMFWARDWEQMQVTKVVREGIDAHLEKLRAELEEWQECARYDSLMEGPKFVGWDRSGLDRCRRKMEQARRTNNQLEKSAENNT